MSICYELTQGIDEPHNQIDALKFQKDAKEYLKQVRAIDFFDDATPFKGHLFDYLSKKTDDGLHHSIAITSRRIYQHLLSVHSAYDILENPEQFGFFNITTTVRPIVMDVLPLVQKIDRMLTDAETKEYNHLCNFKDSLDLNNDGTYDGRSRGYEISFTEEGITLRKKYRVIPLETPSDAYAVYVVSNNDNVTIAQVSTSNYMHDPKLMVMKINQDHADYTLYQYDQMPFVQIQWDKDRIARRENYDYEHGRKTVTEYDIYGIGETEISPALRVYPGSCGIDKTVIKPESTYKNDDNPLYPFPIIQTTLDEGPIYIRERLEVPFMGSLDLIMITSQLFAKSNFYNDDLIVTMKAAEEGKGSLNIKGYGGFFEIDLRPRKKGGWMLNLTVGKTEYSTELEHLVH